MTAESIRSTWLTARDLESTLETVQPFVMPPVSIDALVDLANLVQLVIDQNVPGDFVECGVWRGGSGFLMAELLRQAGVCDRKVWLCDSFQGMPPVEEIDGPRAIAEARDPDSPLHVDNSRVALEEVRRTAVALGLAAYTEFVPGWFHETLPAQRDRIGPIAILRLDCDWYASVRACLDNLYDQVVDGGFIVVDDYYAYDGCAAAVHEFLGKRRLAHRIEGVTGTWGGCEYPYSARFCKGEMNPRWSRRLFLAAQDIARLVPPGTQFVLVDEQQLPSQPDAARRAIPFLERDGLFWGRPQDDGVAIRELERLRKTGARFMVFAWPAFWWFESYAGLHTYLREHFRCALENERVVAFDLQP
jgi:O-methyltransferase